jgi:hypothetical protein
MPPSSLIQFVIAHYSFIFFIFFIFFFAGWSIIHRDEQLTKLQEGKEFDLLVVGGGATGAGIALDAATRGLNIALVEKYDFSSGTSSRSTKLVHGGVRYLEKVRDYSFAWSGHFPAV